MSIEYSNSMNTALSREFVGLQKHVPASMDHLTAHLSITAISSSQQDIAISPRAYAAFLC